MKISFKEILYYAELAQLAYASDKTILEKFPNAVIKEVVDLKLKVFILPDDSKKVYYISFRGTRNKLCEVFLYSISSLASSQFAVPLHEM